MSDTRVVADIQISQREHAGQQRQGQITQEDGSVRQMIQQSPYDHMVSRSFEQQGLHTFLIQAVCDRSPYRGIHTLVTTSASRMDNRKGPIV